MGLTPAAAFTFTLLLVPSMSLVCAFKLPDNATFYKWSLLLESKLHDLVSSATRINFARNVYRSDATVQVHSPKGEDILNAALEKLALLLEGKKTALKNLVYKAESQFETFQKLNNKIMPNLEDLTFHDLKDVNPGAPMTYSPLFRQPVSYEVSGVHIPLEIFDGWMGPRYKEAWWHDSDILSGLNWSASLDETFRENKENYPDLKWQYFGSYFGFMRVYPAFKWPDHPSLPDLFDVRRRSLYIQTSVTPKDVIILIDRSGSVHGPTLEVMKITAKALLNSLGENDYVNVAWFNNKVRWIVPCIDTLVQATSQTRRLLGDAVDKLTESNLTSYSAALDFAFEEFKKFDQYKKPWIGSNCHKIVMFLSDGGTEWPTESIGRHCNESRNGRIKIFTFACGPHPIPTVVLKEMACSTGGYFSSVTALASVRIKIRDYVKVLSRPLAYSQDDDLYQWHNFHRDVGGLGMVATVTHPVFDRSLQNKRSTHLLGVMGIDITIDEMINAFPLHVLGPFGYPFAINTNGFVIFHPRLHDHIIYLEDPPNIYLTDLEGQSDQIEEIEISIIDGNNGSLKNVPSIVPVGFGHAIPANMDYFYGSVETTTFRFGIAVPSDHRFASVRLANINESLSLLLSLEGASIAPWKYCRDMNHGEDVTVQHLIDMILRNDGSCDEKLLGQLLWDVRNAAEIDKHWDQSEDDPNGIHSRFLMTGGGLTIVQTYEEEEEFTGQTNPFKNNLYKKASRTERFVFSPRKDRNERITVAGGITVKGVHVAVIGAEIQQEMIQEVFDGSLQSNSNENCDSSDLQHCYLLNDGGLIVASNVKSSRTGDFIGIHDAELLDALLVAGILKREYRYIYQTWCTRESRQVQAKASSFGSSVLKCLVDAFVTIQWNLLYTIFLSFISNVFAWKRSEKVEIPFDAGNHSCVTRSVWYYHGGEREHFGKVECRLGTRDFRVSFLPNLMLLFLVAQPPCDPTRRVHPSTLEETEDVEFHYCQKRQHYRLRPKKCYMRSPKDFDDVDCGSTPKAQASRKRFLTFAQILTTMMLITIQLRE